MMVGQCGHRPRLQTELLQESRSHRIHDTGEGGVDRYRALFREDAEGVRNKGYGLGQQSRLF
jgi:hypothetical protein